VREYLREHPERALEIENRVREQLGIAPQVAAAARPVAEQSEG
jgi:recombination protein RecA